jgi:peptidoglycan hydrolase-like protein with peptidoglycan-binding domain
MGKDAQMRLARPASGAKSPRAWTLWGLVVVTALAAGVGLGVVVVAPAHAPAEWQATNNGQGTVGLTPQQFTDGRQQTVVLNVGEGRQASSPASGVVTALSCVVGEQVRSGQVVGSIDGVDRVLLATAIPLWRDLTVGDRGPDVDALQAELTRLGYPTESKGVVDNSTLTAARELLQKASAPRSPAQPSVSSTTLSAASFVWAASAVMTATSCPAIVGRPIQIGDPLITFGISVPSARILPANGALPGVRVMSLNGRAVAVPANGNITDTAALSALQLLPPASGSTTTSGNVGSASPDGSSGPPTAVQVTTTLATPVTAYSVPSTSVVGPTDKACVVTSSGAAAAIRVVAATLGKTMITEVNAGELAGVTRIETAPAAETTCE